MSDRLTLEQRVAVLADQIGPTMDARDTTLVVAVLRGCSAEERPLLVRAILDKRADWLLWHTLTQRKWQGKTRRLSRARHHDSVEIRRQAVERAGR